MEVARLEIVVNSSNAVQDLGRLNQALVQTSNAARTAGEKFQGAFSRTTTEEIRNFGNELNRIQSSFNGLSQRLASVKGGVQDLGSGATTASQRLTAFSAGLLGGLAGGLAVQALSTLKQLPEQLMVTADRATAAKNQLALVTGSTTSAAEAFKGLQNISIETGAEMSSLAETFFRVQGAAKDLGLSAPQVLNLVESLSKLNAVAAASGPGAAGAMLQLSQAMSSSTVQVQEWYSVFEGLPAVVQFFANHIEGANGSMAKMTQMVKEHKVAGRDLIETFVKGGPEIQKIYADMPRTLQSTWNGLRNVLEAYVTDTDGATDSSKLLADKLQDVTTKLNALRPAFQQGFAGAIDIIEATLDFLKQVNEELKPLSATLNLMANPNIGNLNKLLRPELEENADFLRQKQQEVWGRLPMVPPGYLHSGSYPNKPFKVQPTGEGDDSDSSKNTEAKIQKEIEAHRQLIRELHLQTEAQKLLQRTTDGSAGTIKLSEESVKVQTYALQHGRTAAQEYAVALHHLNDATAAREFADLIALTNSQTAATTRLAAATSLGAKEVIAITSELKAKEAVGRISLRTEEERASRLNELTEAYLQEANAAQGLDLIKELKNRQQLASSLQQEAGLRGEARERLADELELRTRFPLALDEEIRALVELNELIKEQTKLQQLASDIISASTTPAQTYSDRLKEINQALDANLISQEQANSAIQSAAETYVSQDTYLSGLAKGLDSIGNAAVGAFGSIVDGSLSAADAGEQLAKALLDIAIQLAVILPLKRALDGLGGTAGGSSEGGGTGIVASILTRVGSSFATSLFGGGAGGTGGTDFGGASGPSTFAEKGKVFLEGNVVPFARGGIVRFPTIFPMARGAGLMGEAGPEAIMPLRRLPSGDLGVMAGAAGSNVTVNVINNAGVAVKTEQKDEGGGAGGRGPSIDIVLDMIETKMSERMLRSGTTLNRAYKSVGSLKGR